VPLVEDIHDFMNGDGRDNQRPTGNHSSGKKSKP
jgi:hypothetical protein